MAKNKSYLVSRSRTVSLGVSSLDLVERKCSTPFTSKETPPRSDKTHPRSESAMDWLVYLIVAMGGASLGAFAMAVVTRSAHQRELDEIAEAQYYLFAENVKGNVDERH